MTIGMEPDRVEELDRAVELAIAHAADAYFSGQQMAGPIEEVGKLAREWVDITGSTQGDQRQYA